MSELVELVELRKEHAAKSDALAAIFDEAKNEDGKLDLTRVKSLEGDSAARVEKVRSLNDELNDLGKQIDDLVPVEQAQRQSERRQEERDAAREKGYAVPDRQQVREDKQTETKTLGEMFTDSDALKLKRGPVGPSVTLDIEIKTLFATTAGWAPETTRGPRVLDFVTRPLQVTDSIPTTGTNQTAIKYMEETTFTNAAVEVAEGGLKPEAALALTERTDPVQKIAVWLPVTDEQLEDVEGIQGYINSRLVFMVRQRLDGQILVGDGTAPNISGILDRSGIQTQAKGADPTPDAVHKAMTLVRLSGTGNGGAFPNVVYMHPTDWEQVALLRTADGIYIWGSPQSDMVQRIWGLPVILAEGLTVGTGLVGDTTFTQLFVKKGVEVQVSNSHSDYFIYNKQAIRAEMRVALAVYRPAAFCSVTGI